MESRYNVFLSYHGPDRPLAERLARALESRGFEVFLAPWTLRPGAFWIPALAEAIEEADAFLLLLSSRDPGPWQLPEYYEALNRKVKQPNFPLVPLLLPDVEPRLPFLKQIQWLPVSDPTAPDDLERIVQAIHGEVLEPVAEPWRTLNPYKGLLAFTEADADFFFGREKLTRNLIECLQQGSRFLMLVGNSGVGKSSLVQAGVIAALRNQRWPDDPKMAWPHDLRNSRSWLFLALTPGWGKQPLYSLARAFVSQWYEPEDPLRGERAGEWARRLEKGTDLAKLLEATADVFHERYSSPPPQQFVLVVDQVEELYTPSQPDQARRFAELLVQGSQRTDVLILGTLRSEHYGHLQQDEVLFPVARRVDVLPLRGEDLRRAVAEPAQALGASFEDAPMVSDIIAETAREPGALPLLSYLMEDMWKRMQRRGNGVLCWQDYHALRGVRGVLARRAEDYLATCSQEEQGTLRRLFTLHLVHVSREGDAVRQRARRSECTEAEWAQVQTLAEPHWRLLVTGQEEGEPTAEVAHDVLLRAWDRLAEWIREKREVLEWKGRLRTRLEEWQNGRGMLLRDKPLDEAEYWLKKWPDDLKTERGYIQESLAHRKRERQVAQQRTQRIITGLVAAVALISMLALGFWLQRQDAIQQKDAAVSAQAEAEQQALLANSRRLAAQAIFYSKDQLDLALLLSLEANRIADTIDVRSSLLYGLEESSYIAALMRQHSDSVNGVAFSPDGQVLASSSADQTIVLWSIRERKPICPPLSGHAGSVTDVAFSPDGRVLASGSADKNVFIWDVATCKQLGQPLIGHTDMVNSVAFDPAGKKLASSSRDETIILWDIETHQPLGRLTGHDGWVYGVAFSPDGRTLASGSADHTIILWDIDTHQPLGKLAGHHDKVHSVAFSPDGKLLASGSRDTTIILWNVSTHQPLSQPLYGHAGPVSKVVFSADGQTLASGSADHTIILWSAATIPHLQIRLTGHLGPISSLAFSPDGKTLASSGGGGATVTLWDISKRQQLGTPLEGHTNWVYGVAFSPDGRTLASGSLDGTIILWDVVKREPIGTLLNPLNQPIGGRQTSAVVSVAFSPDGKMIACGSYGYVTLWDVETYQPIGEPLVGHNDWVRSVAFSPDGQMLASGSYDGTIILWNVRTGKPIGQPLAGHTDKIYSVTFSPDGRTLAAGTGDNNIILWDIETRQQLGQPLTGHANDVTSVKFSPDGKTVASGSLDGRIMLWDIMTYERIGQPLTGHTDWVWSVAFSRDGKMLASGSSDNTIILWDTATHQPLGTPLNGHTREVADVDFSPDASLLASAGLDNTVILWDISFESWQTSACNLVGRNLTQAEWTQFIGSDIPCRRTCPNLPLGQGCPPDTSGVK